MKKLLLFGFILFCGVCFGQNTSAYQQLRPLQGTVSEDLINAQSTAFRKKEESRKSDKNSYSKEALDRKAIYLSCISSRVGTKVYLYGGLDSSISLGCINCDKYDSDSIWNIYGKYGSKYNEESIWNKYGQYGGGNGKLSPFNHNNKTPPKLVDNNGNVIGYLTINKSFIGRKDNNLLDAICDKWESISENMEEMTN